MKDIDGLFYFKKPSNSICDFGFCNSTLSLGSNLITNDLLLSYRLSKVFSFVEFESYTLEISTQIHGILLNVKKTKILINSYNVMNTIFFNIYIDQESNMYTQHTFLNINQDQIKTENNQSKSHE